VMPGFFFSISPDFRCITAKSLTEVAVLGHWWRKRLM
jgi:hypothetical protein